MKRAYQSVKPINSRTDGSGVTFAHEIIGENTVVHVTDRYQGTGSYNGAKWNQLIFTVVFIDLGYSMTIKSKDTYPKERLYVTYGQDLYEEDSKEEFYKVALIIAKIHLQSTINSTEKLYQKYLNGEHSFPLHKGNLKTYLASLELDKKTAESIDVENSDLRYFQQYLIED